ncbi:hypothetical protein [Denitromonas halophila]|uniref:Histidine kinase n=1 Tax=Denitromonas halophila TaxID=1629404 RepID=A0A557QXC0_9RHOO|nr:hypothetical protein [Denitromonas halophila]TVO57562.1 hypothetical protein FHP91_07750 [Denitromonas halophila]
MNRERLATQITERILLPIVLAFAAGVIVSNTMHERRDAQIAAEQLRATAHTECLRMAAAGELPEAARP